MKIELSSQKVFAPLTMTIILESQSEVDSLTAIFNTSAHGVMKDSIHADAYEVRTMQVGLWNRIHQSSTRG